MLICNLYYWIVMVYRLSFEDKPTLFFVYFDFIMSAIYLIDMIRIFISPYINKNGKLETNYRLIFRRYASTWLLLDLYAFYPLGYLKYTSVHSEGSMDEVLNWKT